MCAFELTSVVMRVRVSVVYVRMCARLSQRLWLYMRVFTCAIVQVSVLV